MTGAGGYPEGIDCVWIASDARGRIAAFVTAGVAPIPAIVLARLGPSLFDTEDLIIKALPIVSGARMLASMKSPDTFVAMAERGLFVYDWQDVHRVAKASTSTYELVAEPETLSYLHELPNQLAMLAGLASLQHGVEIGSPRLDIRTLFEYRER